MPEHVVESAPPAAAVIPAAVRESGVDAAVDEELLATTARPGGLFAQRTLQLGSADDPLEDEADRVADGMFAQRKLQLGSVDDPLEDEADRVADHVMRMPAGPVVQRVCEDCEDEPQTVSRKPSYAAMRKCSGCEEEARTADRPDVSFIQRQANGDGGSLSDGAADHISATRGSGTSMPSETQAFMEQRLGADFSGVSIHAGASDADLSSELNAHAFTVGKDIYFNDGKYAPSTSEGQHLLAHELVHVVQQSPDVRRKEAKPRAGYRTTFSVARETSVQRMYFAPDTRIGGTLIHSTVLPLFAQSNSDLFVEVAIPGSSKDFAEPGKTGVADLYKAHATGGRSRTVGLKFDEVPEYLRQNTRLRFGGGAYNHNSESAPTGGKHKPRARRMNLAPTHIELGDLKPGGGAEAILGGAQLNTYTAGLEQTRDDLNTFLAADPQQSDGPAAWRMGVTKMSSLTIPPRLVYPSGIGIARSALGVYEGTFAVNRDTGLVGSMFVYKDPQAGIWSYEWIPEDIPPSTGGGPINSVLDRLNNEVIPPLIGTGGTGVALKRIAPSISTAQARQRVVQKKDAKFDNANWKSKHYTPWKAEAEKVLADKGEMKKAKVAEAAVELKGRVPGVPVPVDVQERGKGVSKIKHWTRFGGIFGWLREKFDFIFVKVHAFAKSIKQKVQNLVKKVGGTSFGSWIKAAARVVFKIFKLVGAWVVGQVLDRLVDSLRAGIMNNIRKVIDMITPDDVKAKIQEFEEFKEKYQAIIDEKEDELIKRFFGDKLEFFENLKRFEDIADTLSTIATLVEWGVRLLACASPPAIGCLWNFAMSVLEWAFGKLMQTCWFTKKVYEPVISNVDLVRNFPTEIAAKIVETGNEYIPVPSGFDPIFAPITVSTGGFSYDCGEGGDGDNNLTPERQAILDLVEELGPDKFNAVLELSLKRGAGPWVLMTADRITAMKDVFGALSADEISAAANDKSKGVPQSVDNFLKSIQGYSRAEKKLIEHAAEERKKAAELKELGSGGKGGGGKGDGGKGGGKGTGPSYEIIKGPTGLDESKATHVRIGVEELTLTIKQKDAHSGVSCDAKLVLNDDGTLITIPLVKIKIDGKTQLLTTGEQAPPNYYISFSEEIAIKFSTGEVKKLTSVQLNEKYIKFSSN